MVVMNWLNPIKELYNMYLEQENTPRIVKVADNRLDFDLDLENSCHEPPPWTID